MASKALAVAVVVTLLVAAAGSSAFAQAGRAEINGTVFDQAKAVVPGVTITVVHQEQGTVRTSVTSADGRYVVPTLVPGTYTIRTELEGFQTQVREGLVLSVGQELTADFVMTLSSLAEEVVVTGLAPVVETTTTRIGTNVTNQEIDNLPSQGRNQLSLMQLVPGLTPTLTPGTFEGGQYNANGREVNSNLFMIDGVYNNDDRLGGNGGQARVTLDTMAEFQILTHQYTAEFGGSSGMIVNAVSKSGTNKFLGRAFSYLQDESLNATDYFLKLTGEKNPQSGSKVYGFGAGGPIVRNKAFWFFNIERDKIDQAVSLQFPAQAAPLAVSYSDAAVSKALNTFVRFDYQPVGGQSLGFRWVRESAITMGENWEDSLSLRENLELENDEGDQVFNFNWTSVVGGRATNEFKATHVREMLHTGNTEYFDSDMNYIELNGRDQFDIGAENRHPDFTGGPRALHGSSEIRSYVIEDAFTVVKPGLFGDHTFKVGAAYSRNSSAPTIVGGNDNGTFTFRHNLPYNPANPLTYPSRFSIRLGEIYYDVIDNRYYGYAQDKWQLNKKVTLNLGLRYDYQQLTPRTKNAFAPRVGVAYDPTGNGRTVVRGGFGKFYEYQLTATTATRLQGTVISPSFQFDTGEDRSADSGRIPAHACLQPSNKSGLAIISPGCAAFLSVIRSQVNAGAFINTEPTLDGDRRLGYLWGFSLGVKRELVANLAVSMDYVGNRGRNQTALIDINEPRLLASGQVGRPGVSVFDPTGTLIPSGARGATFQRVLQFQSIDALNSDFNSAEFALEKRYSHGWSGRAAYTLSRAHDVGIGSGGSALNAKRFTNDLNPRGDYGRTNYDNRHALAFSLNANPWRGLGAGTVVRYYSGYPVNETVGTDVNKDRDNNDRPVAGVDDKTRPIQSPLDSNGMAIRNGIDGNSVMLIDLRSQYVFRLSSSRTVGVFWEIYNAANRVNFGNPTGNRQSSNFMVPVVAGDPRTMQLGVRFTF